MLQKPDNFIEDVEQLNTMLNVFGTIYCPIMFYKELNINSKHQTILYILMMSRNCPDCMKGLGKGVDYILYTSKQLKQVDHPHSYFFSYIDDNFIRMVLSLPNDEKKIKQFELEIKNVFQVKVTFKYIKTKILNNLASYFVKLRWATFCNYLDDHPLDFIKYFPDILAVMVKKFVNPYSFQQCVQFIDSFHSLDTLPKPLRAWLSLQHLLIDRGFVANEQKERLYTLQNYLRLEKVERFEKYFLFNMKRRAYTEVMGLPADAHNELIIQKVMQHETFKDTLHVTAQEIQDLCNTNKDDFREAMQYDGKHVVAFMYKYSKQSRNGTIMDDLNPMSEMLK